MCGRIPRRFLKQFVDDGFDLVDALFVEAALAVLRKESLKARVSKVIAAAVLAAGVNGFSSVHSTSENHFCSKF